MIMRKITFLLACAMAIQVMAQEEKFRLTFENGYPLEFNVNDIKNITFVEDAEPLDIVGKEWFDKDDEAGDFESINLQEDGIVTYYLYNKRYHSGSTYHGTYSYDDYIFKMDLNTVSFHVTMPIVRHSANGFTAIIAGNEYDFFKVQKTYYMLLNDNPIAIGSEGDSVTYVDNELITLKDNKIKPKKAGTGFALVKDSILNTTIAYKVIVDRNNSVTIVDWTKYFNKTKDDIITEFGIPDTILSDDALGKFQYVYNEYGHDMKRLHFIFDNETETVSQVSTDFNTYGYFEKYYTYIQNHYLLHEDECTSTELVYYDTEDWMTASVKIVLFRYPPTNLYKIDYAIQ